jgi:thiol-disulfide isomerase/thioredoxin
MCGLVPIKSQDTSSVKIGTPFPEYKLVDISYYKMKDAYISEFKGKWLILDFWGEYCSGCISSFPKISALQKKYAAKITIVSVGVIYKDKKSIVAQYEKSRAEKKLELAITFDSTLSKIANVTSYPDAIFIDPKGVVRGRLAYFSEEDIEMFLLGKQDTSFITFNDQKELWKKYDKGTPYLINGNGGKDTAYLYRSLIARYKNETPVTKLEENGRFEVLKSDLLGLYKYAYFGKSSWIEQETEFYKINSKPEYKTRDSNLFTTDKIYDRERYFSYSLCYPRKITQTSIWTPFAQNKSLQETMQNDLKNFFPYDVALKEKKVVCYKLVASKSAMKRIKKNGIRTTLTAYAELDSTKFYMTKIETIINMLHHASGSSLTQTPIFNKTRIISPFLMTVNVNYYDSLIEVLKENGLILKETRRHMKTLVIKDRIPILPKNDAAE